MVNAGTVPTARLKRARPRVFIPWTLRSEKRVSQASKSPPWNVVFEGRNFDLLWEFEGSTITSSRTSDVLKVNCGESSGFLKRYWYPTRRDRFRGALRNTFVGPTRAAREWFHLERLCERGLSAIRPLALGEDRRRGVVHRALILTEALPESRDLAGLLANDPADTVDAHALGRWIRTVHRHGFLHGGLAARNVIVGPRDSFSLIDPPRARWFGNDLAPTKLGRLELEGLIREIAPTIGPAQIANLWRGYRSEELDPDDGEAS